MILFLLLYIYLNKKVLYIALHKLTEMDLSQELKQRREELGVTQEYLAELAGVGLRTIKTFESGKANPRLETLTKLSEVLGMELVWSIKKINP